jgi:hypothetical protein
MASYRALFRELFWDLCLALYMVPSWVPVSEVIIKL